MQQLARTIVMALLVGGAVEPLSNAQAQTTLPAKAAAAERAALVRNVKSWAIQYRGIDPFEIAASPFDLVVIDIRPDVLYGTEFTFSRADVAMMQRKPDGGRRVVIAYMSVGEAEDYRHYWQAAWTSDSAVRPRWIGPENPRWRGNFPVRFWEPAWQAILFGAPDRYLDRIIDAGFDGVYLDRIDVYQEYLSEYPAAERDMIALVGALSGYARSRNPKFLTVLQNAEELTPKPRVRAAIDVFAKEDLFYGIEHDGRRNSRAAVATSLAPMRALKRAGIKILLVEYPQDAAAAGDIRARAAPEGFAVLLADRKLRRLAPVFQDTVGVARK